MQIKQNRNIDKEKKPLIVLDTNVLVAGLCRRLDSPSYLILKNYPGGKYSFRID